MTARALELPGDPASPRGADVVPLPPRRAATRARICAAARHVFFARGFTAATMEEVAEAAGIRRSTLYLHFREKDAILAAVAGDYTVKLREVIAGLPGPAPARAEVAEWVRRMALFVLEEREATEVVVSMGHLANAPLAALAFGEALWDMMAGRLDAFRRAREPGQGMALAWATAALEELGWALCQHARTGGTDHTRNRLAVAGELISRFVAGEFA